jgi:5-formyltetrahydrofolate cyclo-ligase
MTDEFKSKDSARQWVWQRLEHEKAAAFPFPPQGRIPNFKGSAKAARRLFEIPIFAQARIIKVNPDSAQKAVRIEALRRGITVFVPTPRLAGGFMKLDPKRLSDDQIAAAATISKATSLAETVALRDLPPFDAIVCGSVAVTRLGYRCGKGAGYADLEFAILSELGQEPVPVATTVHPLQIVDGVPQSPNDLPLSFIVTPDEIIEVAAPPPPPRGIDWDRLDPEAVAAMPVLDELRRLQKERR